MKQNFTCDDFQKVYDRFESKNFHVRFNKAGNINIEVIHPEKLNSNFRRCLWNNHWKKAVYTLYNKNGKVLIRSLKRTNGGWTTVYPLNMTYKSRHATKYEWDGHYYYSYNVGHSYLGSVDEAIDFFGKYLLKYHENLYI